ncbi:MAG TPA: MFS transporter [Stellaceae bacterium]
MPGDTVLYLLLPLHAAAFGVTLPEAGFLLAVNRLVRIAGYGWVMRGYERHGPRTACFVAALGAAASTLGYATLSGVFALAAARLLWGLSFAALNIATQALATADPGRAARWSGQARAIISAGPMLGLLLGAVLATVSGPRIVFLVLASVALLGVPMALLLPGGPGKTVKAARRRFGIPAPLDLWSFIQGLTLDGVFVVSLSILAAASAPKGEGTLAAGAAMALRYLAEIVLGPPSGLAAERWGVPRSAVTVSLLAALGFAVICGGLVWAGIIGIVLLRGMLQPLAAPLAAVVYPGGERVPAIARLATWRDLGAGTGPMLAGFLLSTAPTALYAGSGAIYAAATLLLAVSLARRPG